MERVIIKEVYSKYLERTKKIRIILPSDYDISDKLYPVLYMHDGQNLINPSIFSGHSWEVMRTMDELSPEYGGIIIVGIDSDDKFRIMEYSNYLNSSAIKRLKRLNVKVIEPEGDKYGKFIVEELKPLIDSEYRVNPSRSHTFIAGSSCGGNISIYLGIIYQNIFSCIGAFSPAYYIVKKGLYEFLDSVNFRDDLYIYHDMGTKENGSFSRIYFNEQKVFHDYITKKIPEKNILQVIDEGAKHSEIFWAKRFKEYYKFCQGKRLDI